MNQSTGVSGNILLKVEEGYRMANPGGVGRITCPAAVFDTMMMCWRRSAEERPTFEYLETFFTDYEVTSYGATYGDQIG